MNKEITKLDDKYLVLKWDDIGKYLSIYQKDCLHDIIKYIAVGRHAVENKNESKYVVLNLDDDIDLKYLRSRILNAFDRPMGSVWRFRVRDIAGDLVNAILKAKKG